MGRTIRLNNKSGGTDPFSGPITMAEVENTYNIPQNVKSFNPADGTSISVTGLDTSKYSHFNIRFEYLRASGGLTFEIGALQGSTLLRGGNYYRDHFQRQTDAFATTGSANNGATNGNGPFMGGSNADFGSDSNQSGQPNFVLLEVDWYVPDYTINTSTRKVSTGKTRFWPNTQDYGTYVFQSQFMLMPPESVVDGLYIRSTNTVQFTSKEPNFPMIVHVAGTKRREVAA